MKRPLTPYRSALLIKMMNCFCRIVDWPKGFSLTPARTTVILIIANLWHAAYRIWTWAKSFFFFISYLAAPRPTRLDPKPWTSAVVRFKLETFWFWAQWAIPLFHSLLSWMKLNENLSLDLVEWSCTVALTITLLYDNNIYTGLKN